MAQSSRRCLSTDQCAVVMEGKCITSCTFNKPCLAILIDIFDKGGTTSESYWKNIKKIVDLIETKSDSLAVFRTLCTVSFLDRYSDCAIIADVFDKVDRKISVPSYTMVYQLEDGCLELLTRMVSIENLSSVDTDMICLLCTLCKHNYNYHSLHERLLQVARMAWPYTNRLLWDSDHFVDFICDIWETVGKQLEEICLKNFTTAWKFVCEAITGKHMDVSRYSRLRLLAIFEYRKQKWSLPAEVMGFYKRECKEFLESRKKEVFSALGYHVSKRRTSLTTKRGLSAADFIKRKLSSETHEKEELSLLSSTSGSSECLSEVFEDVFDIDESKDSGGDNEGNATKTHPLDVTNNRRQSKPEETASEEKIIAMDQSNLKDKISSENKTGLSDTQKNTNFELSATSENTNVESNIHENKSSETELNEIRSNGTAENEDTLDNSFPRRLFVDCRKTATVKVPQKYVGRVIGSRGSVIISIQEQSGARVHLVKENEYSAAGSKEGSRRFLRSWREEDTNITNEEEGNPTFKPWPIGRRHSFKSDDEKPSPRPPWKRDTIPSKDDNEMINENNQTNLLENGKIDSTFWTSDKGRGSKTEGISWRSEDNDDVQRKDNGIISNGEKISLKENGKITSSFWSNNRRRGSKTEYDLSSDQHWRDVDKETSKEEKKEIVLNGDVKENGRVGSSFWTNGRRGSKNEDEMTLSVRRACNKEASSQRDKEIVSNKEDDTNLEDVVNFLKDDKNKDSKTESPQTNEDKGFFNSDTKIVSNDDETSLMKDDTRAPNENGVGVADDDPDDGEEFKIIGTEENVRKAKQQIEDIIRYAQSTENRVKMTRSLSEVAPSRVNKGFKQIQRSLSCPVTEWDDSCPGTCVNCEKGCYCRAFLLYQSQSPRAWVRPDDLSLARPDDWVEFIVETKVNFVQRPPTEPTEETSY